MIDAPHTNVWGNELILRDGEPIGSITSAAFGHTIGKPVALGLITRTDGVADRAWIESGQYEIDLGRRALCGHRLAESALRSGFATGKKLGEQDAGRRTERNQGSRVSRRPDAVIGARDDDAQATRCWCKPTPAPASARPTMTIGAPEREIAASAEEVFKRAEMIVKVKEPQAIERAMLREGQILFTYLHLAPDPEQAADLLKSGAICIAYETVTSPTGGLPLLAPMSEVAGRLSVQAGARCLEKSAGGMGMLLGGVAGVRTGPHRDSRRRHGGHQRRTNGGRHRRRSRRHRHLDRCAAPHRFDARRARDDDIFESRQRRARSIARRSRDLRRADSRGGGTEARDAQRCCRR